MPSDPRRRESKRIQKQAAESVDSDEGSGGEDRLYSQARSPHHVKKLQKPSHGGNIIIKGDLHIKNLNDLNFINGRSDEPRPQRSSTPIRNPPRRQQRSKATKRASTLCDSSSASEEDVTSHSEESEPEDVAPKRPPKSMVSPERPIPHSQKKRREPADEGYHTSGTVSAYTAQVPGKVRGKEKGKGKQRSVSSVGSSSSRPRVSSSGGSRTFKDQESESEATSCHSDEDDEDDASAGEDGQTDKNAPLDDEEESDDDFLMLPIHIGNPNNLDAKGIGEKAILDTGTKVDWISQMFYDKIRDMGVKLTKLSPEELKLQYRDFNGKKFQPKGKVDLTIQTEEFKGEMKCRTMRFFIASKATFVILFGRETIRKHGFFTRSKRETDGEGVLAGLHDELTEAQKAEMKRKKEEQKKYAQERKKMRDSKTEKMARQKENASSPSASNVAVHLATTVSRSHRTRSPPSCSPRQSSSSMEGTW
ncbi:hypothetical protein D0Z07_2936 [Hyphodiscus hymeniophilus]|uniref:Uncharacterized protein n=1 Tax=Hyphodiscus hymeniophilus TaxID=353542 RepID=A0A9P6VM83_9HELO|nr:hypothetical protein D0Z07_2936 [Hyphodiscus hymeniophilus]